MKPSIFIQIASYRDPQLLSTIEDLLKKASYPERLTFGICNQYHIDDKFGNLEKYKEDKRFRIDNVKFHLSKGACWARHRTQKLYNGEDFTLQIDSHMRFVENWDKKMIRMLRSLQNKGYSKPLLTGYPPSFEPDENIDPSLQQNKYTPLKMVFDFFSEEGIPNFKPQECPILKRSKKPLPSRFLSAGFIFTLGIFCKEIRYDPELYFIGEEISLAARAFTNGYDLFHPNIVLLWHQYIRTKNKKHWDDNAIWHEINKRSIYKIKKLLGIDQKYFQKIRKTELGLGKTRTLQEYEEYIGIHFLNRKVQEHTLNGQYPISKKTSVITEWLYSHQINITFLFINTTNKLLETKISFFTQSEKMVFEKAFTKDQMEKLAISKNPNPPISYRFQIYSVHSPIYYTVEQYDFHYNIITKYSMPIDIEFPPLRLSQGCNL